jgi:hypothetical protein
MIRHDEEEGQGSITHCIPTEIDPGLFALFFVTGTLGESCNMITQYIDPGEMRRWDGIHDQPVVLLLYSDKVPIRTSLLHVKPGGGVCIFASPPTYTDPEVRKVNNWSAEARELAELQGNRHAFIGGMEDAEKLGSNPKYVDI